MKSDDEVDLNAAKERIKRYIQQHPEHADHFKTIRNPHACSIAPFLDRRSRHPLLQVILPT